ncbi:MAG: hypothetical protein F6K63_04385 [Moorea sp. SIO1G6]|nr:hypothetical protein [Moorena sp. SIO1G6]NET63676.1 hypothetical protein [Moorena sp. SIO1G6]
MTIDQTCVVSYQPSAISCQRSHMSKLMGLTLAKRPRYANGHASRSH